MRLKCFHARFPPLSLWGVGYPCPCLTFTFVMHANIFTHSWNWYTISLGHLFVTPSPAPHVRDIRRRKALPSAVAISPLGWAPLWSAEGATPIGILTSYPSTLLDISRCLSAHIIRGWNRSLSKYEMCHKLNWQPQGFQRQTAVQIIIQLHAQYLVQKVIFDNGNRIWFWLQNLDKFIRGEYMLNLKNMWNKFG